jgi:hypothetical protein
MVIGLNSLSAQEISRDYYIDGIENDFIGVYLPVEYITILKETKNHSLAMHCNDDRKYHDILIVIKNNIFSNAKFHDGYAIKTVEGNLYKFIRDGNTRIVIDNNGYSYIKIGEDPSKAYDITEIFILKIVFESLLKQNIGVSILENKILIPFLYFFVEGDTFSVELDDLFWEEGSSVLLKGRSDRQSYFTLFMLTDGIEYTLYNEKHRRGPYSYKEGSPFLKIGLNDNKEIFLALAGLNENTANEVLNYLDDLKKKKKRKVINTMFALNGYSFATEEWKNYFSNYSWYKPNKDIRNDRSILNIRQQTLLDYLNK